MQTMTISKCLCRVCAGPDDGVHGLRSAAARRCDAAIGAQRSAGADGRRHGRLGRRRWLQHKPDAPALCGSAAKDGS